MSKIQRIDSTKNEVIKWVAKLQAKSKQRYEEKLFVVEGFRQLLEVEASSLHSVFACKEEDLANYDMVPRYKVSEDAMKTMSSEVTPQGILAVVKMPKLDFVESDLHAKGLYLILENLQDPGNLGTILRVCDAVKVDAVIMSRNCVDLFNPKVVKATMGSLWHLPIVVAHELEPIIQKMNEKNISVYGAYLTDSKEMYEFDYQEGTCFVIGNEGKGISNELIQVCKERVRIPMPGRSESLNASIATSVLLYEALRQRR